MKTTKQRLLVSIRGKKEALAAIKGGAILISTYRFTRIFRRWLVRRSLDGDGLHK